MDLSRPRIEFSHQTKTVFVGGLEDGIDDPELMKYFSEFGFVTRALRIPNGDEPKRKYGFIDFDDYDAVGECNFNLCGLDNVFSKVLLAAKEGIDFSKVV